MNDDEFQQYWSGFSDRWRFQQRFNRHRDDVSGRLEHYKERADDHDVAMLSWNMENEVRTRMRFDGVQATDLYILRHLLTHLQLLQWVRMSLEGVEDGHKIPQMAFDKFDELVKNSTTLINNLIRRAEHG